MQMYDSKDLEDARAEGYAEGLAAGRAEGEAAAKAQAAAAQAQTETAQTSKISNARAIMAAAVKRSNARTRTEDRHHEHDA